MPPAKRFKSPEETLVNRRWTLRVYADGDPNKQNHICAFCDDSAYHARRRFRKHRVVIDRPNNELSVTVSEDAEIRQFISEYLSPAEKGKPSFSYLTVEMHVPEEKQAAALEALGLTAEMARENAKKITFKQLNEHYDLVNTSNPFDRNVAPAALPPEPASEETSRLPHADPAPSRIPPSQIELAPDGVRQLEFELWPNSPWKKGG